MEAKQYATKQPTDHWRNERGSQNVPRDNWKWKDDKLKPMGCSKSRSEREIYSDVSLSQEIRKISNKQTNLSLKQLEKEEEEQQQKTET